MVTFLVKFKIFQNYSKIFLQARDQQWKVWSWVSLSLPPTSTTTKSDSSVSLQLQVIQRSLCTSGGEVIIQTLNQTLKAADLYFFILNYFFSKDVAPLENIASGPLYESFFLSIWIIYDFSGLYWKTADVTLSQEYPKILHTKDGKITFCLLSQHCISGIF